MSPAIKGKREASTPHQSYLPTALGGLLLSQDDSKSQELHAKTLLLILCLFLQLHKWSTNVVMPTEICWEKERD